VIAAHFDGLQISCDIGEGEILADRGEMPACVAACAAASYSLSSLFTDSFVFDVAVFVRVLAAADLRVRQNSVTTSQ